MFHPSECRARAPSGNLAFGDVYLTKHRINSPLWCHRPALTAAISSHPLVVSPATLEMYHRFGSSIYAAYGFRDAFNASFPAADQQRGERDPGWVDPDYVARGSRAPATPAAGSETAIGRCL